jgi:hypothetical protein
MCYLYIAQNPNSLYIYIDLRLGYIRVIMHVYSNNYKFFFFFFFFFFIKKEEVKYKDLYA